MQSCQKAQERGRDVVDVHMEKVSMKWRREERREEMYVCLPLAIAKDVCFVVTLSECWQEIYLAWCNIFISRSR